MKVIIRDTPDTLWSTATDILYRHNESITGFGVRKGCGVSSNGRYWYIYYTKTSYVIILEPVQ